MILSEAVISIFFRLLNFGLLIYGARYVYHNYVCSAVRSEIEVDEKKVAILAQQKDAFYQQELSIAQEIERQEKMVAHLTNVLATWQAAAEKKQRAQEESHQKIEEILRKKAAEQSEHIAEYMLARRALSAAIHELEISLTNHFNRDDKASEYITSLVSHMDKDR